jgi:hypothetical protein
MTHLWGRLATCGPIVNRSIRAQPGRQFSSARPALIPQENSTALPSRDRRECRRASGPSKWMKTGDSTSPPLQSGLGVNFSIGPRHFRLSPDREGGDCTV